jgi:phosphatidylglycerophosphate synthase
VIPQYTLAQIRLKAKRSENLWFDVFYFCSSFIVWAAARLRLTPNQLTLTAFALNTIATVQFLMAAPSRSTLFVTVSIFTVAHILDCADGHLAYVTNQRSESGYWLDSALDIFKLGFISCCFFRLVDIGGISAVGSAPFWLSGLATWAVMGTLVNYSVSLHAGRYKDRFDGYTTDGFARAGVRLLSNRFARIVLSHVREYGNVLVCLAMFLLNTVIAMTILVILGSCHFLLAIHRVYRVSRTVQGTPTK